MTEQPGFFTQLVRWGRVTLRADFRERIAQDSLVVFAGHGLRLGLGLISSALLARGLGPNGLSVFAVVGAAMGIASTVADLGLRISVIRYIVADVESAPEKAYDSASAYTRLKLLTIGLLVALVLIAAGPLASLLNLRPESGPFLLRVGSLVMLATALSGIVAAILHALRRFGHLVAAQTANVALTVIFIGILWWTEQLTVFWALLVGAVTATVAAILGYYFLAPPWRAALRRPVSLRSPESRRLLSFSRWMWLSNIFSIVAVQVDILLLNVMLAPSLVGIYALARNLAQRADTLNQTVHTVLVPNVSALAERNAHRRYVRRSLLRSLLLTILIVLILPLARPLIPFIYGTDFIPAVNVFYALMVLVLLDLFVSPLVLLALPMDEPRLLAISDAIQVGLLLVIGLVAVPRWGIYGIVLARVVARAAGALVTLSPILRALYKR